MNAISTPFYTFVYVIEDNVVMEFMGMTIILKDVYMSEMLRIKYVR